MTSAKTIVKMAVLLLIAALTLSSCFIFGLFGVTGNVVNVKAGAGADQIKGGGGTLAGVELTLTPADAAGQSYTTVIASDGFYNFPTVASGKYTISSTSTTWIVIPTTFDVTGLLQEGPTVLAYPSAGAAIVTVIMSWENTSYDMDLSATYGLKASADNSANRVYYSNKTSNDTVDDGYTIVLDRDVNQSTPASIARVETLGIYNDTGENVTAEHQIRVFVDSYDKPNSLTGVTEDGLAPAYVKLWAMLGTKLYGHWIAPVETAEDILEFIKIDIADVNGTKTATISSSNNFNGYRAF